MCIESMPEDNRNYKKEMLNWMGIVEVAGKIGQGLQSHVEKERIDAQGNRDSYCLEGILNDPFGQGDEPQFTQEEWNRLSDEQKTDVLQNYLPLRKKRSLDLATSAFHASPEGVLKEGERYNSKLENLAFPIISDEKTRQFVGEEHGKLLGYYVNFKSKENLARKIEDGGSPTREEMQEIAQNRE